MRRRVDIALAGEWNLRPKCRDHLRRVERYFWHFLIN